MGGLGSGQWQEYASKQLIEDARYLDLASCLCAGLCYGGEPCRGTIKWADGWKVQFFFIRNVLTLMYEREPYGNPARPITMQVTICTTRPNYGGIRPWFSCPECSRHCRKLYLAYDGYRFMCRICARLVHKSTRREWERLADMIASFDRRVKRVKAVLNLQQCT